MKRSQALEGYLDTAWKMSKCGAPSGSYFPAFGLNTERCWVSLRIKSEYGKIRTRRNSVFGHFSHSENPVQHLRYSFCVKRVNYNPRLRLFSHLLNLLDRACWVKWDLWRPHNIWLKKFSIQSLIWKYISF